MIDHDGLHFELRMTGWWVLGGDKYPKPTRVTVLSAYKLCGHQQQILDLTRQHCGQLRLKAKSASSEKKQRLERGYEKLRVELSKTREFKQIREARKASEERVKSKS